MGTPAAVKVGPGLIYVAPIGTTEPTNGTATLPSAWLPVGYTEEGHTFTPETTLENVEVAEELDPVKVVATKRESMFEFSCAEFTVTNLAIAYNGGTIGSPANGLVDIEPPDLGDEARLMVMWQSDELDSALLLRRVVSAGAIAQQRKKAPDKVLIPIQFRLEIPTDGATPWKHWVSSALSYDAPHS